MRRAKKKDWKGERLKQEKLKGGGRDAVGHRYFNFKVGATILPKNIT
jgi:hypothetical protein